jgi:hypothetical protein
MRIRLITNVLPFLTTTKAKTLRLLSTMHPRTDFLRLSPDLLGRKHECVENNKVVLCLCFIESVL